MKEITTTISTPQGDITLSTGKIATLAHGSILAQKGGTVVLTTTTVDPSDREGDFFPLTIEYLERMYAHGTISGSRVNKREGFPSESAIIKARQVDHTIRPLFPKGFRKPVNVIITVLADDHVNDPEQLAVLSASVATMMSGIPFAGPAASVIVAVDYDLNLHINPEKDEENGHDWLGEFVVSAANGKVLNIEGWGKELSEDVMDRILDEALGAIGKLNKAQTEFLSKIEVQPMEHSASEISPELLSAVEGAISSKLADALYVSDKQQRDQRVSAVTSEAIADIVTEDSDFSDFDVKMAIDYLAKKLMRKNILQEEKRFSGRALDEVRKLNAEVDLLPTVHGSALFSRGYTQSLSIATLGSVGKAKILNDMTSMDTEKRFMHHYSFPPYSTGEAGRVRYKPGRREIGHGAIGENALMNMLPSMDEFPYSVRVVSEIMTSNGSTSMAATCAASMALMAAGVPLKKAVAGIGVGLVTGDEDQQQYKLVLDIEGVEDFYGDMDFKVTGTDEGVTAIQFETKLKGVEPSILKEAFRLSKQGRDQVLEAMNSAISSSREELAESAPRVEMIKINPEHIGGIIGPGGKYIKELIENAGKMGGAVEVDIQDDGRIHITANNKSQLDYVKAQINEVAFEPEIGDTYDGVVDSVMPYGAFVDIGNKFSGLVHVSEMADDYVKDPGTIVKEGQKVKVKLLGVDRGKYKLSMKQA